MAELDDVTMHPLLAERYGPVVREWSAVRQGPAPKVVVDELVDALWPAPARPRRPQRVHSRLCKGACCNRSQRVPNGRGT